jgi:hypothetical protein
MIVTLDIGEMATIRVMAAMRRSTNQVTHITDRRISSDHDDFHDEMNGLVAEVAFAKHFNVYPDIGCSPRAGGHDCIVNGQKVDIKAVTGRNHRLIAAPWKNGQAADLYVLGIVAGNEVDFVGWAWATELICSETITDLGHGPTHALNQSQLHEFARGEVPANSPSPAETALF